MARMPVSGVRTSWANAASAVSTMPGSAAFATGFAVTLGARLRVLPAASFGARFFAGRFLGGPDLRFERDAGAMIPLTLAGLTMPWAGAGSHAAAWFAD